MYEPNDRAAPKGFRGWWTSPPRSGMRLIIAPWEYRNLRAFARVRAVAGMAAVGLGLVTLAYGGTDFKTYGWALGFAAIGAANLAFAYWLVSIARSGAAGT